jgi:Undecaprenyl-phosphate glucose phosphotransferase
MDASGMIQRSRQSLVTWFVLWDLLAVSLAWIGAYYLRFKYQIFPILKERPPERICWENLPLVAVLALVAFRFAGMYEVHRLRRTREELPALFKGVVLLVLFVQSALFYTQENYASRLVMLLFSGLSLAFVTMHRRATWNVLKSLRRKGWNQSNAVIVGTGRGARRLARALRHASWMGIRSIGFVEDRPRRFDANMPIIGRFDDLPRLIETNAIRHVFIALPMKRFADSLRVYDILSQQMVEVRLVADLPNLAGLSLTTTAIDGLPVIGLRESPHFGLNHLVKRGMDIVIACLALLVLAPVMGLIALAIKATSPGPILYRQERCGLNGRTFRMLKFRSMRVDAEVAGAAMTQINDPRKTRLGSFLRATSLDELPQLFNVLRGDMSLVGPRPERPIFIDQFKKTIPNYMARHAVKCGMTGWAQVHGWRGNTSYRKRLQFDLYYITHWNPLLDLRILWLTVWRGFFNKNAY